ncbi:GAF domain-containing protein [Aestuariirhabdus litorea]|uniref:GAF domain-containing protein n=1 Tax=Aestuariirhabdus litorea TaxID=2528527 RepID=A0A3P3VNW1_9GAMM|nr:GAF domain-containing protein [Aestuariirhabdus litorea]RRJ84300.1 GAF domain-containing protein [Aestuariirhabdus litorea]RWW97523.1 GAF domain-containing protein [Endozoicomonadaceae bacterium GTF-13]
MATTVEQSSFYKRLLLQAEALVGDETDAIANMANLSSLLFMEMDRLNWAGFYLAQDQQLVLGPFQGRPACIRIDMGKGVCGTAALTGEPQIVLDVHQFPGHIACDAASNSELVIPFYDEQGLVGVLDLDSPERGRFDAGDLGGLQPLLNLLQASDYGFLRR